MRSGLARLFDEVVKEFEMIFSESINKKRLLVSFLLLKSARSFSDSYNKETCPFLYSQRGLSSLR